MEIFDRGELHSFGKTEDGEDYTGYVVKIIAEAPNGGRWEHKEVFACIEVEEQSCEYGSYTCFIDISDEVKVKVDQLIGEIKESLAEGQSLNMDDWCEISPSYGSNAHAQMGDALLYDEDESQHYQGMRF